MLSQTHSDVYTERGFGSLAEPIGFLQGGGGWGRGGGVFFVFVSGSQLLKKLPSFTAYINLSTKHEHFKRKINNEMLCNFTRFEGFFWHRLCNVSTAT